MKHSLSKHKLFSLPTIVVSILLGVTSVASASSGFFGSINNTTNSGTSGTLVTSINGCTPYPTHQISNTPEPPCSQPFLNPMSFYNPQSTSISLSNVGTAAAPSTTVNFGNSCGLTTLNNQATGGNPATPWANTFPTQGPWGPASSAQNLGGTNTYIRTSVSSTEPTTYTEAVWFNTTGSGNILSITNPSRGTGTASQYDEMIWVDPSGHVVAGAYNSGTHEASSPGTYNNGTWHFAVASLSSSGLQLYVDGSLVATNTGVTSAAGLSSPGYWHIGWSPSVAGSSYGWPDAPTNASFPGSVAGAAIFSTQLPSNNSLYNHTTQAGYDAAIRSYSPIQFWPLNTNNIGYTDNPAVFNTPGIPVLDNIGNNGALPQGTFMYNVAGPYGTSTGTQWGNPALPSAITNYMQTSNSTTPNPNNLTTTIWFKTTGSVGLMSLVNTQNNPGSGYTEMIWIDPSGHIVSTSWNSGGWEDVSPGVYNNGAWHQVTVSYTSTGMWLHVDGALVAHNASSSMAAYAGYWHIGYVPPNANNPSWSDPPTNSYFYGTLAGAGVFPFGANATEVTNIYTPTTEQSYKAAITSMMSSQGNPSPAYFWPLNLTSSPPSYCNLAQVSIGTPTSCFYPSSEGCNAPPAMTHLSALEGTSWNVGLPATINENFSTSNQKSQALNGYHLTIPVTTNSAPLGPWTSNTSQPLQDIEF